jgi:hypothetical protein
MDTARAHEEFLRTRIFPGLDGLRCLSIVLVVAYHVSGEHTGFLGRGYLGVALFFAISGFLITSLLLREREAHGHISLARFYGRRSLRIFPLYYAVLTVYVMLTLIFERGVERSEFFANLPAFLTYTSNWFVPLEPDKRIIFYFAWSLATEEQFYLMWPSVMRVGHRWGAVLFMTGLLGISLWAPWAVEAGRLDSSLLGVRILASHLPGVPGGLHPALAPGLRVRVPGARLHVDAGGAAGRGAPRGGDRWHPVLVHRGAAGGAGGLLVHPPPAPAHAGAHPPPVPLRGDDQLRHLPDAHDCPERGAPGGAGAGLRGVLPADAGAERAHGGAELPLLREPLPAPQGEAGRRPFVDEAFPGAFAGSSVKSSTVME